VEQRLRIGLAQIDTKVGDPTGNGRQILAAVEQAAASQVDVLVLPELTLSGYPPEDLLLREDFVAACEAELDRVAAAAQGVPLVLVGLPRRGAGGLENTAAVLSGGSVRAWYQKQHLPNYGVFDEARYFAPGHDPLVVGFGGWHIGVTICEDIWLADGPWLTEARAGADVLVNLSASPYAKGRPIDRDRMLAVRAQDAQAYVASCNLVGGQDELVFDGTSAVYDPDGSPRARAESFRPQMVVADLDPTRARYRRRLDRRWRNGGDVSRVELGDAPMRPERPSLAVSLPRWPEPVAELREALVLGIRDYVSKNGFSDVMLQMSGGIDSSVVAALAAEAVPPARVHGVYMPSAISSEESREDASRLAAALGIDYREISIAETFGVARAALGPSFGDRPWDIAEENLQARIRGLLSMALSNKFGWLVLVTGNKSEMATGYATLYGDMAGGLAVLKDVYKEDVYRLAREANRHQEVIPARVLVKPPSAELSPGQRDDQSLPPYPVLDPILQAFIEEDLDPDELVARGMDPAAVALAVRLVNRSEYKRRQAPVGIRVSARAFGRDRRMPITGAFERRGSGSAP
jgi:NAD+ synthase (glutamine-hydrolysing)